MFKPMALVLAVSGLAGLASSTASAQTASDPEPEAIGVVFYRDTAAHTLVRLERATVRVRGSTRLLGYGGHHTVAQVEGAHSSVRVPAGSPIEFVIALPRGVDPAKFRLFRFGVKPSHREVELSRVTAVFHVAETGSGTVPFDVAMYGQSSYRFVLPAGLPPGEYGFSASDSQDVFLFGVGD